MKEVLEKILNAEAEAQKAILLAQRKASEIVKKAKSESVEIKTDIVSKAEDQGRQRRKEAQKKFSSLREESIAEITSEIKSLAGEWEKSIPGFAEEIFHKVINPEAGNEPVK